MAKWFSSRKDQPEQVPPQEFQEPVRGHSAAAKTYAETLRQQNRQPTRLLPPPDGGCRHGRCYTCNNEIGSSAEQTPKLQRGNTFWFCSDKCYMITMRSLIPEGFKYLEDKAHIYYYDDDDFPAARRQAHAEATERNRRHRQYLEWAEPYLWSCLLEIERLESARLAELEKQKRMSYRFPDPPPTWTPLTGSLAVEPLKPNVRRPSADRCADCGSPERSDPTDIPGTPFWFCSPRCYFDTLKRFVPTRWFNADHADNQDYRDYQAALRERNILIDTTPQWAQFQAAAIERGRVALESRFQTEAKKHQQEEADKEAERLQKEREFEEVIKWRPIPEHIRIHTAIIAKTGWGKTQLLQTLVLEELQKPDPASLIILDSTGEMVRRIQKLALFNGPLGGRLVVVDPAHSPALNMFDISNPRFGTYTQEQREDLQTQIVSLFDYIFKSDKYDLSGQMGVGFAYAARVMLSRTRATVTDLRRLLEENPKSWEQSDFAADIRTLDPDGQDFFRTHFFSESLRATRASIARRLHGLIAVPAFRRMFTAAANALDLYSETQEKGSIILVNTNHELLGGDGHALFGRYVIARTAAAAIERSRIPREERRTTHLIIDEASPYFDDTFDSLLTRVRQYNLKVTVAFQHSGQINDKIRNAIAGQTSVKYVGGASYADARWLANELRCEPEFIQNLETDINYPPQWSQFAVYADNFNKHAMRLTLPFYAIEKQPTMTDAEHAELLRRSAIAQMPEEARRAVPRPATPAQAAPTPPISDPGEPAERWGE